MTAPRLVYADWDAPAPPPLPTGAPYPAARAHDPSTHACRDCPTCIPVHVTAVEKAEDLTAAQDPALWEAYRKALVDPVQAFFDFGADQMQVARDWWTVSGFRLLALQQQLDAFWKAYGDLLEGAVDANRVSFVPRDGWIEVELAVGLRAWVASEADIDAARQAVTASVLGDQLAALNAEYNAALAENQQAAAASQAVDAHYEAAFDEARAWMDAMVQRWNDHVGAAAAAERRARAAYEACLRRCRTVARTVSDAAVWLLAGGLILGGTGAVVAGEPFDTATVVTVAAPPTVEVPVESGPDATPSEAAGPVATPAPTGTGSPAAPPDLTADEVMWDRYLAEVLGLDGGDELVPFLEPGVIGKFALGPVTVPVRSSYSLETLDERGVVSELGDPLPVSATGTAVLTLREPAANVPSMLAERYGSEVDLVIGPGAPSSGTADELVAVGATIAADLLDPAVCEGRWMSFTAVVDSADRGPEWVPDPAFPGDYYRGGDTFANFDIVDCQPRSGLDATDEGPAGIAFGAPNPGVALMTVNEGTTAIAMVLPPEVARADDPVRFVFSENVNGVAYSETTARHQMVPDAPDPAPAFAAGTTTADCDFGLVPPEPAPTDGGGGTPAPTSSSGGDATGGGGAPPTPTPSTGGSSGGGATPTPSTGGGVTGGGATDGGSTGTGDAGAPAPPATDPDETKPGLVATGAGLVLAGAALAATRVDAARRGEGADETSGPASGGADGASGPAGEGADGASRPASGGADGASGPASGGAEPPGSAPPGGPTTGDDARRRLRQAIESDAEASTAATRAAVEEARRRMDEAERAHHSAVARYTARRSAEENEGVIESLHDWWTGKNETEDTLLRRAAAEVDRTREAYRRATAEYLALRLLTAPPSQRPGILDEETRAAVAAREEARTRARRDVEGVILADPDDRTRAQTLAARRGELETASLRLEAIDIARSRLPDGPGRPRTRDVLEGLTAHVRDTREDRLRRPGQGRGAEWWEETEAHYRMREWLRDTERDLDVDRFVAVAEEATVLDHRTGLPVPVDLRHKIAADRITWLSEYLESVSWRRSDPRRLKAAELRRRLRSAYRALDFLGYGHVSMSEYFLATGQAIRERQSQVNDWFLSDYLGLGDRLGGTNQDLGSGWRTAWAAANVGLGTYARVSGLGDESVEKVRSRLAAMNEDADIAVLALSVAAETPDPDRWPSGTRRLPDGTEVGTDDLRELLETFGYIVRGPDGRRRYRMPTGDRTVARATAVRLPGASWLDVVSARNAAEILLSVAVPELASLRVAAWVSRAGVSGARMASVVRVLVDQGLGFALDVGFQASRVGWDRADLAAIGARSVVDNLAGLVSRGATGAVARGAVSRVGASAALREALADPATRRAAESVVGELLGIPADAATQLVVESARGHGVSADDVWAALLGSAMNRGLVARLRANHTYRGVAQRLESAIDTEAVALDRHLNRQADAAFERVLDDRPPTRESGDAVFEALRLGELTWEQLQRVYKSRGDAMTPLMERVNELRNRLVNSIGTRARLLARQRIAEHYDPLIAAASGAEAERLRTERQAELDKVAEPTVEVGVALRFTEEALEVASASRRTLIESLLAGVAESERADVRRQLESLDEVSLRDRALRRLEERYTAAVRKAAGDEIAPGSAGVTSDVDRSWSSEFLRRAAREIVLVEMTRGRADGELGPTTARAFDVNEYLNVMTRIPALVAARSAFADRVVATIRVGDSSFDLTHADAVEAHSLAAAMLHMDTRQRERFQRNLTEGLDGDALTRMRAMLQWARRSLAESETALASHVRAMRERLPAGTPDSEVELRARDELYGERMRRLDELGHAIDRATEPAERARLMSEWELLVNVALRDGIETYSDMANLEIIVIRMQSAGGKPDDLMRSEDFRLGSAALAGITAQQIRAMLNDQILMLMHHVHTLHSGHESPAKAVRSFAKYAERALLALNLLGEFDPTVEGRYSDLYRATRALMRHKNDPARLVETLANLRGGQRGVDENLRWYLDQLELIPGMAGLTAGPPAGTRPEPWARSLAAREWVRRRLAAEESGDAAAVTSAELAATVARLVEVEGELRRTRALSGFLPADLAEARRLVDEIDELEFRVWFLGREERGLQATGQFGGERWRTLWNDLRRRRARLEELRRRWRDAGEPVDEATQRRLDALERERASLGERRDALGAELARSRAVAQGGDRR